MRKSRFAGSVLAPSALALAIALAGCGDNSGNPTGYFPEGQHGQDAYLVTFAVPPSPDDSTHALLFANILAPPPANGFVVYTNPGDEGFRAVSPTVVPVSTTGSGYHSYFSFVEGFDPAVGTQVVARGVRDGFETSAGPVTNTSTIPPTHVLALLRRVPVTSIEPFDSSVVTTATPTLSWQPVPNSKYIVTVSLSTGQPVYIALTSATTLQIRGGGAVVFEDQPLRDGGLYNWTIQALDEGMRVVGVSREPTAFFVNLPDLP